MTDIVERLRLPVSNPEDYVVRYDPLRLEAAADIERLREYKRAQAEDIMMIGQEVGRLQAENARLMEALKPFADQIELIECTTSHTYYDHETWPIDEDQRVKIGDLRQARATLAEVKKRA